MKRTARIVVLALVALLVMGLTVPAMATESSEPEEETTDTTVAPEPVFENGEPVLIIPPETIEEEEQPWTSRFIYPTLVAVTILLLIGLGIWYNRNIRRKYEVIPE